MDYKYLNDCTDALGYPIPNIKLILERLALKKATRFAIIDLTSGYHQLALDPESQKYTSFVTPSGSYKWKRVPFGLKGAPSYFQALIAQTVLRGLIGHVCELYIDDILVYGSSDEEYFTNLELVLQRLKQYNLTITPDKAKFGLTEVDYLGHHITAEGVTHSRERIEKVLQVPLLQVPLPLPSRVLQVPCRPSTASRL